MEIEYRLQDICESKFGSVPKWAIMICINGHSKVKVVRLKHLWWFAASRVSLNLNFGFFGLLHVLLTTAFTLSTRSSGHADTTLRCLARTGSVSCESATVALDNWCKLAAIGFGLDWSVSAVIVPCWFECIIVSLLVGIPACAGASLAMKI
jgi:hypothetical protein